jgi:pimeloyl-ACP methyl ester carboxylesterase
MQEPFFFPHGDRKLFGVYYPPQGEPSGKGFVICNGFGKELNLWLSFLTNFARGLAALGHAVLRFDYTGHGDSEGEFTEATISRMRADVERAVEELLAKATIQHLGLLGTRLGGYLAAQVAGSRDDVKSLILWEPVPKPWAYLFGELRQTVAAQTVLFKEVRITREQIVDNVLAGRPSSTGGYDLNVIDEGFPLGAELIREAKQEDLVADPPKLKARALIVNVRKKAGQSPKGLVELTEALKNAGVDCRLEQAVEACLPWKYEMIYATRCPDLYAKTLAWLQET